jgi:hypothetical protein
LSKTGSALELQAPIKTGRGLNDRLHWRSRWLQNQGIKRDTGWILAGKKPPPLPLTVDLIRCSRGVLDGDNLVSAFKPVRDAVAAWIGLDDANPRVTWRYHQERGPTGIRLRIQSDGEA